MAEAREEKFDACSSGTDCPSIKGNMFFSVPGWGFVYGN